MAESGNMFFDQYNKVFPEMQEKVVPLALKKMELDMETEKWNRAKSVFDEEQQRKKDLAEFIKNKTTPIEQQVTLPGIAPTNFKSSTLGNLPVSEGIPETKTTQLVPRTLTREDLIEGTQFSSDPLKTLTDLYKTYENNDMKLQLLDMRNQALLDKAQRDYETKIAIAEMKGADAKDIARMKIQGARDVALLRAALSAGNKDETKQEKTKKDRITRLENFQKLLPAGSKEYLETEALISRINSGEDFDPIYPQNVGTDKEGNATLTHKPSATKDKFGFTVGEVQKGHKYIGNNQWQPL
jgi:hypothetical protein